MAVQKRPRQALVTHIPTGEQTLVNTCVTGVLIDTTGNARLDYEAAARLAGYRYAVDCGIVPLGQEIPLPFDEVPLVNSAGSGQKGRSMSVYVNIPEAEVHCDGCGTELDQYGHIFCKKCKDGTPLIKPVDRLLDIEERLAA